MSSTDPAGWERHRGPRRLTAIVALAALVLGGCGFLEPGRFTTLRVKHFDRDGADVLTEPIQGQALVFLPDKAGERYCRTPTADFAATLSEGVSFSLVGRAVGEDGGRGAVSLGGRNPAVLMTRELLYRACELSANIQASPAQSLEIYRRFLETVEKVAQFQTGIGVQPTVALPTAAAPQLTVIPPIPRGGPSGATPPPAAATMPATPDGTATPPPPASAADAGTLPVAPATPAPVDPGTPPPTLPGAAPPPDATTPPGPSPTPPPTN